MPAPTSAIISRVVRTDVELPDDISEVELRQYELETELRRQRDTVKHLEGALRCVARVVKPYASSPIDARDHVRRRLKAERRWDPGT